MQPSDEQFAELSRVLQATAEQELDCAEMLDHVAAYLRAATAQAPLDARLQQVAQHLRVCAECREELLALIEAEGLDPRSLLQDQSQKARAN